MKLVTFWNGASERAGLVVDGRIFDLEGSARRLGVPAPASLLELLRLGELGLDLARRVERAAAAGEVAPERAEAGRLLAPLPRPPSVRDAYAFRQHVETSRRNRGLEMIPEFDRFPVFYFTNHHAVVGPGPVQVERDHLDQLDFELEVAAVIGRRGRNVRSEDADAYLAGLMVMNDLSARRLQMEEMKLNLGPAKGKDFATAMGPWLVTLDELEDRRIRGPRGSAWELRMEAFHEGRRVSSGNLRDMAFTFAEIIERASYGCDLFPGDVIGSGTVGTGCFLELNGTAALRARAEGREHQPTWLRAGEVIELEVERLGRLTNRIEPAPGDRRLRSR